MDDRVKSWAVGRLAELLKTYTRQEALQIIFNEATSGKIAEYRHKHKLELGIDFVGLFAPGKKRIYYFKV